MSDKYKTGECRKFTFWAVYDATSAQKYIKMDVDTGCLAIFDVEGRAAGFASDCPGAAYGKLVLYSCPQPAPDVAGLVGALDEMIDVAQRVDSWESFPSAPIERAQNALATYRKQGGES